MIPVEKLREVRQVLYHQSCPDGTVSAMICFAALRLLLGPAADEISLKSCQYHTTFFEQLLEPRPGQLFVDITPPREKWEQWKDVSPIVLDHHESARHITEGLMGTYGENSRLESGARLALEHVLRPVVDHLTADLDPELDSHNVIRSDCDHAMARWEEVSRLAAIRDTWQDGHEDFEKASVQAYGLMTLGARDLLAQQKTSGGVDFDLITRLGEMDFGKAKFMAEKARKYTMPCPKLGRDLAVYVYNCTEKKYISDGCHVLLKKDADIAVSFFYTTDERGTQAVVSLRTNDPIAAVIAAKLGGGGHDKASGFGLPNGESISMDVIAAVLQAELLSLQ